MYALVSVWAMAEGRLDEQLGGLHSEVVPRISKLPDFVAGTGPATRLVRMASGLTVFENEVEAGG